MLELHFRYIAYKLQVFPIETLHFISVLSGIIVINAYRIELEMKRDSI